jgi:hypothetical protein
MSADIKCPKCGASLTEAVRSAVDVVTCSGCGARLRIRQRQPAAKAEGAPSPVPETHAPPPPSPVPLADRPARGFMERMKANRALAGRLCSSCGQVVELGQDIYNCPACQMTMHLSCFEQAKGCTNPECPKSVAHEKASSPEAPLEEAAQGLDEDMVECKFCGELIKRKARKCKHCGELVGTAARAVEAERKAKEDKDANLTTTEIIFGLLCGTIACIFGVVWAIQGKKKGLKMIGLAIASQFAWAAIQMVIKELSR